MGDESQAPATAVDRRRFMAGAAGAFVSLAAAGGLAGAPAAAAAGGGSDPHNWRNAEPKPIPGGLEIPGIPTLHVWPAGPEGLTLPYTGATLFGLDVDASTITDFDGVVALAYLVGTARGSDGATYNLETDFRAFAGSYTGMDGKRHRGAFAFV
jgi:hypothetical protein